MQTSEPHCMHGATLQRACWAQRSVGFCAGTTWRFLTLSETFSWDMLRSTPSSSGGSSGIKMLSWERARDPMGFKSLQRIESVLRGAPQLVLTLQLFTLRQFHHFTLPFTVQSLTLNFTFKWDSCLQRWHSNLNRDYDLLNHFLVINLSMHLPQIFTGLLIVGHSSTAHFTGWKTCF